MSEEIGISAVAVGKGEYCHRKGYLLITDFKLHLAPVELTFLARFIFLADEDIL